MQDKNRLLKIPALLIGAVFIVAGIANLICTLNFIRHSDSAPGIIAEMEIDSAPDLSSCRPRVKFATSEGKIIYFTDKETFLTFHKYHAGESAVVIYNPDNPEKAQIKSFFNLWKEFFIITLIGLILIAYGKNKFEIRKHAT